jgi:hypothetical protein
MDEHWWFLDTKDGNGNPAFYLQNDYSGRCMGVGSSLASGAGVIQYTCNGAVDEKWWYSGVGNLRNVYSGLCLAPASGSGKGAQLIQRKCDDLVDESWEKKTS